MNSSNIIGALIGGAGGYWFSSSSKQKWWWTAGSALGGALLAPVAVSLLSGPPPLPPSGGSPAPSGGSPASPPSGGGTAPAPPAPVAPSTAGPSIISLAAGFNANVSGAAAGTVFQVELPSGANWSPPGLVGDANSSVGSAPSAGSNPAGFTYNGGGSTLSVTWVDATAGMQNTSINISD